MVLISVLMKHVILTSFRQDTVIDIHQELANAIHPPLDFNASAMKFTVSSLYNSITGACTVPSHWNSSASATLAYQIAMIK